VAGVRKNTLILTFPGSVKGAVEGFQAVSPVISHLVDLINDRKTKVANAHGEKNGTQELRSKVGKLRHKR